MLAADRDPWIRVYVVWPPILAGREGQVAKASRTVADPRATHYWDGEAFLADAYAKVLGWDEPAWDVYLLYGPDARWPAGAPPPAPDFLMHQLGDAGGPRQPGPFLDAAVLAERARALRR